jgi:hypothetical protein
MKIDRSTYLKMQADINIILPYYMVRYEVEKKEITEGLMHDIWFRVYANRAWADNDPRIFRTELGERLLRLDKDFDLYPCDTNDDTIGTALNKIRKEFLN